jgi:ribose transport system permease protein
MKIAGTRRKPDSGSASEANPQVKTSDPTTGDPTTGDPTTGDPTTGGPGTGGPGTGLESGGRSNLLIEFTAKYALVAALGILIVVFWAALPTFMTGANWRGMIESQAVLILLALAVTLPLRTGDFDLSIGSVAVFSAAISAVLSSHLGWNPYVSMLVGLAGALGVGIVNCVAILILRIDAFITTLGTMTIVYGLSLAITNTQVIIGLPAAITNLSQTNVIFGLPAAAFYGWAAAIVLWYFLRFRPLGLRTQFVGGNRDAARLIGLKVRRIRATAFMVSALLSGLAGIVLAGTIGAVDPTVGQQYLLQPYAAAFLGATAIQLGRFNIVGTVVGLYLIVVGVTGLELLGASTWISEVFYGGALLIAVGLSRLAAKRSESWQESS